MEKDDKINKQSRILEFSLLENQLKQLEQQIILLDQQINKQKVLLQNLDEFKKVKKEAEIFLPFSEEIFAKVRVLDNENLLINVGGGTFLKKSIEGVKEIIQKQVDKLGNARKELSIEIDKIVSEMLRMEQELSSK